MKDNYGRNKKGYESLKSSRALTRNDLIFKTPNLNEKKKYKKNNLKINISFFKDFKNLKSYDDKSIAIILDGKIVSEKNKTVITTGEIVKSYTLKQLANYFKVDGKILLLRASKI